MPTANTFGAGGSDGTSAAWALLTVNLDAIVANYATLRAAAPSAKCAAVVKADAYGLGAAHVAPALEKAGCRTFFVAHLDEGIALRAYLSSKATIAVLNGNVPGTKAAFTAHGLVPVLNSLDQANAWIRHCAASGTRHAAMLQLDTGMARFGLSEDDIEPLLRMNERTAPLKLTLVLSHLACADEPKRDANAAQRTAFLRLLRHFPGIPGSLAASSGIFLGSEFHFDVVRPGAALYGLAPNALRENPMAVVVELHGRVVQVRQVPPDTPVGYGHTARVSDTSKLATIAVGYADGWVRSSSNRGAVWYRGKRRPIVGRVSMDSIVVDASAVPDGDIAAGSLVELIGSSQSVDAAAAAAGTIGYELLTRLGSRLHRSYITEGNSSCTSSFSAAV